MLVCVGHTMSLAKTAEVIEVPFGVMGCKLGWIQETMYPVVPRIAMGRARQC